MSEEERGNWVSQQIYLVMEHLIKLHDEHPDHFWEELKDVVTHIVVATADLDDTDWPPNLHLGDVLEKHVLRYVERVSE